MPSLANKQRMPSVKAMVAWRKVNWTGLAMTTVMVRLGYRKISTYAEKNSYVSSDHTVWSRYGSLLSGFRTVTENLVIIATLSPHARQNSDLQIVRKQKNILTPERCIVYSISPHPKQLG